MTISVSIVEDSVNQEGVRLTTVEARYPRFIHAEVMTHRVFSRNASSSRARPIRKVIREVIEDPAEPVEWGSNRPGMQAGDSLTGWRLSLTWFAWHAARWCAVVFAWLAMKAGAHKQVVNRILEPWSHITVLISSTDWENFFALRCHEDADPTIRLLAHEIRWARKNSRPRELIPGEWHLPYVLFAEKLKLPLETLKKISAARCARVSYLNHSRTVPSVTEDLALYARLIDRPEKHASPLEHQASPDTWFMGSMEYALPDLSGNFTGWTQHRKTVPGEAVVEPSILALRRIQP